MTASQIAVIGDIHGRMDKLETALEVLADFKGLTVFLGDYVDRGPDSALVLDRLVQLRDQMGEKLLLLRGNHEVSLMTLLDGGGATEFVAAGGLATINSYLVNETSPSIKMFVEQFPPGHLKLLRSTELYYETDNLLLSHCGFNPSRPDSRLIDDVTNGRFPMLFDPALVATKQAVFGHYVQRSLKVFEGNGLTCIDTGCGVLDNGHLTIFFFPSHHTIGL